MIAALAVLIYIIGAFVRLKLEHNDFVGRKVHELRRQGHTEPQYLNAYYLASMAMAFAGYTLLYSFFNICVHWLAKVVLQ